MIGLLWIVVKHTFQLLSRKVESLEGKVSCWYEEDGLAELTMYKGALGVLEAILAVTMQRVCQSKESKR